MIHFRRIVFQLFFSGLLLTGCNSTESFRSQKELPPVTSFPTTLINAVLIEQAIGSQDVSYDYTVEIDTSLHPNVRHYRLTKVKRFLRRTQDSIMDYAVEYFASSDDSVRTILHEWNVAKEPNSSITDSDLLDSHLPQVVVINAFQSKFAKLDSTFTSSLGRPTVRDIKSDFQEETERDDIKWIGENQLNVYLQMFKRDNNTYRQIRAIIYPR